MKNFISKINEKINIYFLIIGIIFFIIISSTPFISYKTSGLPFISHTVLNFLLPLIELFDNFTFTITIINFIILLLEIIFISIIYCKKKFLLNIAVLIFFIITFIMALYPQFINTAFVLNYKTGNFNAGFYLMLALIIVHLIFTVLTSIYKADKPNIDNETQSKESLNNKS